MFNMHHILVYGRHTATEVIMSQTAKLFINGRSQAVRIPKEFAFEGITELLIRRDGQRLILEPARKNWLTLNEDTEALGDDFLSERPDLFKIDPGRVELK